MERIEQERHKERLKGFLEERKICVCCGSGGVGKTTMAAILGVGAALLGERVLVLTIDPARRLADALGMTLTSERPQRVPLDDFLGEGLEGKGSLDVWMLQPASVFDEMVRSLSSSQEKAETLFRTTMYQAIRQLIAGMQEYMAGESLYQFAVSGEYDLIVLDTPPSRNAIDFLAAPDRILGFFDSRILKVFAPKKEGWLLNRARKIVMNIFTQLAGNSFWGQAQEFVALSMEIFEQLKGHAETVRHLLASEEAIHLLITSPAPLSLKESLYFQRVLEEKNIPFGGFILNRSLANHPTERCTESDLVPDNLQMALNKLQPSIEYELQLVDAHRKLFGKLDEIAARHQAMTIAVPHTGDNIENIEGLIHLARQILPL